MSAVLSYRLLSDLSGAYYNPNGMDIEKAVKYRDTNKGSLEGFEGAEKISNEDLLTLPVELLNLPAATEDVINSTNAPKIRAES